MKKRGIAWRNVAGYSTESVTQHTFALLFYLLEKIRYYDDYVKDEKYINENGAFDISKCDLIAYSNGNYYSLGKKIGRFGFSVQKKKKTAKKSGKTIDKKRKK